MPTVFKWSDVNTSMDALNAATAQLETKRPKKRIRRKAPISRCSSVTNKLNTIIMEHNVALKRKAGGSASAVGRMRIKPFGMYTSQGSKRLSKNSLLDKVPTVYKFKDIYDRNKRELMRQIEEEARRLRQFRSRPVPDFSRYHQQMESRTTVHSITVPITPTTLRKSMESKQRLELQRQEWEREQLRKPKFTFHSTAYLRKEPFMPKHTSKVIVPKPFHLRSEERAKARKAFNITAKNAVEERLYAKQKERIRHERELAKQMRQQTNFKAKVNPWKRFYDKFDAI